MPSKSWISKLQDIRKNRMLDFNQNTSWYFTSSKQWEFLFLVSVLICEIPPKPVHTSCISSSTSIPCGKRAVVTHTGNTCCNASKIVYWEANYYSRNTNMSQHYIWKSKTLYLYTSMLIIFIAFSNVSMFSLTIRSIRWSMCEIVCVDKFPTKVT